MGVIICYSTFLGVSLTLKAILILKRSLYPSRLNIRVKHETQEGILKIVCADLENGSLQLSSH